MRSWSSAKLNLGIHWLCDKGLEVTGDLSDTVLLAQEVVHNRAAAFESFRGWQRG